MPRGLHSLVYSVIPHLKVVVVLYILTEGSTLRRAGRVLSVALGGPHHTPFESARTARGLRARNQSINLVGRSAPSIHALWRAERRGTKMGDVHAGHALQGLMGPTVSWGTLGAHLATAKGARGARVVS